MAHWVHLLLLLLLLCCAISCSHSATSCKCHPNDQAALLSLAATHHPTTFPYNYSSSNACCCSWQGVTCTAATANYSLVTALTLPSAGLTGEFPPQICNLTALRRLSLANNGLSGRLLPCLATHLRRLRSLDLSWNQISSLTLITGGGLPSLVHLDLSYNSLSGSLPPSLFNCSLHVPSLTYLNLSSNSLSGSLPPSLFNCSLIHLDLRSNSHSGSLPPSLFNCSLQVPSLTYLDLSWNSLVGSISPSIRNLQMLQSLSLSHNLLSGPIPAPELASLANLIHLDIGYNYNFDPAPFPPCWANLSLAHNSFNSTIPPEWENLAHLTFFDISGNTLSANPTSLPSWLFRNRLEILGLRSLRLSSTHLTCDQLKLIRSTIWALDVSDNNFTSSSLILECFCQVRFPSLKYLNLSHNPPLNPSDAVLLTPRLLVLDLSWCELSGLTNNFLSPVINSLAGLSLSHNKLQGNLPSVLADFKGKFIDISHNSFTGLTSAWKVKDSTQLYYLSLSNNKFKGDLGDFMAKFVGSCPLNLGTLDVSFNDFTGAVPPYLAHCSRSIERIKMGSNHLRGEIPADLGLLPSLQTLSLHNNELKGSIPSTLSNCSSLRVLDLSYNRLDGDVQQALFISQNSLTSLRVLLLNHNRLTGSIPNSLGISSPNLQLIGLSNNRLTGVIPPHLHLPAFKKADATSARPKGTLFEDDITLETKGIEISYSYILKILTSIDFSGNQLSGPIPPQLGDMTGLMYLDLSRNNLSSSIPAELSKLKALESLDLSFNKLTGYIPTELGSLSALAKFNVSFNEGLSGEIPAGPQLEDANSFLGDDKLCGIPKNRSCPRSDFHHSNADDAGHHHRNRWQRFEEWLQGWASTEGMVLGFVVGFVCTIFALHVNYKDLRSKW